MYVTIETIKSKLYTLLRENLRSPILQRYLQHISLHTLVLVYDHSHLRL